MSKKKETPRPPEPRSEFGPLLETIAAVLLLSQAVMRLLIADVDPGNDFFVSGLVWLAAGVYFTARGLGGDGTFRFSGVELPLMFFCMLGLLAAREAPYPFGAQRIVWTWVSNALLFVVLVDWMHRRGVARLWTAVSATAFVVMIYGVLQSVALLPSLMQRELVYAPEGVRAFGGSGQPFGTMVGSNTLAGFIAVLLPMAIGSLLDARALAGGRPFWMSPNAVLRGAFVILSVLVLMLTESRGGSIAAAAGLAAFGTLAWARGRGWPRRTLAVAAGVALAAGVAVVAGGFGALKRVESFRLRAEAYWPAATRMIDEAPWRGYGLGGYEEHYARVKPEIQTYARDTHNDYLQIAAEIGVPGAALFTLVWLVALWRGCRGETPAAVPRGPTRPVVVTLVAVGVVAFGAEYLLSGTFRDNLGAGPGVALALLACWAVYAAFTVEANAELDARPGPGFGLGALAGIVAYLVHATVDHDFTSAVFSQLLFMTLAFALARTVRLGYLPLPRPAGVLMALACFVFGVFMVGFFAPDVQGADSQRGAAEERFIEATRLPPRDAGIERALGEAKRLLWARAYEEGEEASPGAYDLNEGDADTAMLLVKVYWFDYASQIALVRTLDEANLVEQRGLYDAADDALGLLLQADRPIRPIDHNGWFWGGMMRLRRYDHFVRVAALGERGDTPWQGMANSELSYSDRYLKRAVELYPTFARYRAWLARARDLQGDRDGARREAAEAKRFHSMATEDQFRLTDEELDWVEAILAP